MPVEEPFARIQEEVDKLTFREGRTHAIEGPPSFGRLVVGVDGSTPSDHALAWARKIAKLHGSEVHLVHAVPEPGAYESYFTTATGTLEEALNEANQEGREILMAALATFEPLGVRVDTHLVEGDPARALCAQVEELGADLLVVGSQGRGPAGRLLLGSVSDTVKSHAKASVLIAKGPPEPRHLLLPVDASRASKRAAIVGLHLARAWGLPATVLHVIPTPIYGMDMDRGEIEQAYGHPAYTWSDPTLDFALEVGHPGEEIVRVCAKRGAGLVVMGSRALPGEGDPEGSVSKRVTQEAEASVLLVQD